MLICPRGGCEGSSHHHSDRGAVSGQNHPEQGVPGQRDGDDVSTKRPAKGVQIRGVPLYIKYLLIFNFRERDGSNEGAGGREGEGGDDDDEESAGKKRKKRQRKRTRQSRTRVPTGPVVLADGEGGQDWGEEEARLSDLDSDIDEYILTEQEVRKPETCLCLDV